ncbi:MAG: hypothetical protein DSY32_03610 [Aquifex sp.]|nr:MAG: hypothetical protein DSY32_03610 [Aquifex sp.]
MMKVGSLGYALLKALSYEPEFVEESGKIRFAIPSSLELLERRVKPLSPEEAERKVAKEKQNYERNKDNALKVYENLKKKLERQLEGKEKAVERIAQVVEEIEEKLKKDPTNTTLMKKFQYWLKILTIRQKQVEYLKRELGKFEQFLNAFRTIPATEFPLWEEVGRSKGTPPRRVAQPEEYSTIDGFAIHYLNEI